MKIPIIKGVIDRRILANYRVDPDVLAGVLPNPFRPKLVDGWGIAGICLIRLKQIHPRIVPGFLGISSENAAHRIAVEWDRDGEMCEGVYIPRRDTSSRLNSVVGGRLFPGVHNHARFQVQEWDGHYSVALKSDDRETSLAVDCNLTSEFPEGSVFPSIEDASEFFQAGSLGYSVTNTTGLYDGLELRSFNWKVEPLKVNRMESSFFEDRELFPSGSIEFDSALLMRNVEHEWHSQPSMCIDPIKASSSTSACKPVGRLR